MNILDFFSSIKPSEYGFISRNVELYGIIDFSFIRNPYVLHRITSTKSGGGISLVDFGNAIFEKSSLFSNSFLYISEKSSEYEMVEIIERDSINGIGIQSNVESAAMFPENRKWCIWFSSYLDIALALFKSREDFNDFISGEKIISFLERDVAVELISQWNSNDERKCFLGMVNGTNFKNVAHM